jgi:hypothetical protein
MPQPSYPLVGLPTPAPPASTVMIPTYPMVTTYGAPNALMAPQTVGQPLPMPASLGLSADAFTQQVLAPVVKTVEKAPETAKALTAAIGAGIAGAGTFVMSAVNAMNLQNLAIMRDAKGVGAQLLATNPTKGWIKHVNLPMVAAITGTGALVGYFHKTIEDDAKAVVNTAKQEETILTTGFNRFTHALAGATGQ